MDTEQANRIIEREKSRRFLPACRGTLMDLMRSRERLYNGLAMALTLLTLVSMFLAGNFYFVGILFVILAGQCLKLGTRCREAREALEPPAQF